LDKISSYYPTSLDYYCFSILIQAQAAVALY